MFLNVWFYVSILFLVLFVISSRYAYKFAVTVLNTQEAVERSLDILDSRYRVIAEILEKPVFFDSLEVRQCVAEIKKTREAILFIANILTEPFELAENEENMLEIEGKDGS